MISCIEIEFNSGMLYVSSWTAALCALYILIEWIIGRAFYSCRFYEKKKSILVRESTFISSIGSGCG